MRLQTEYTATGGLTRFGDASAALLRSRISAHDRLMKEVNPRIERVDNPSWHEEWDWYWHSSTGQQQHYFREALRSQPALHLFEFAYAEFYRDMRTLTTDAVGSQQVYWEFMAAVNGAHDERPAAPSRPEGAGSMPEYR